MQTYEVAVLLAHRNVPCQHGVGAAKDKVIAGGGRRQMAADDVLPGREDDGSLFSAGEIESRLVALRQSGFPARATERMLHTLMSFCCKAEPALAEIVQHVDEAMLRRELQAGLRGTTLPPFPLESGNALCQRLIRELTARRCLVIPGDDWRVSMHDGTRVDSMLEPSPDEAPDVRLGRLALLVLGITKMRDHPRLMPPY